MPGVLRICQFFPPSPSPSSSIKPTTPQIHRHILLPPSLHRLFHRGPQRGHHQHHLPHLRRRKDILQQQLHHAAEPVDAQHCRHHHRRRCRGRLLGPAQRHHALPRPGHEQLCVPRRDQRREHYFWLQWKWN